MNRRPSADVRETAPSRRRDEAPVAPLTIDVIVNDDGWGDITGLEALMLRVASAVCAEPAAGIPSGAEAALALDSDAGVRALNRQFRGIDKPTNVLSFPAATSVNMHDSRHLGDIVLARETVLEEARNLAIAVTDHVAHLVTHGLLHLVGFDHQADGEAEAMESLERTILARLGIADPYADRPDIRD